MIVCTVSWLVECSDGFYGLGCLQRFVQNLNIMWWYNKFSYRCPLHNCSGNGKCSPVDGTCLCSANWTGNSCYQKILSASTSLLLSSLQFTNSDAMSVLPSSVNLKTTSGGCSSVLSSRVHSKLVDDDCSEVCKLDPSTQDGNKYGLAILVFCMITIASVLVHVFICVKFERENRVAFICGRTKHERQDYITD